MPGALPMLLSPNAVSFLNALCCEGAPPPELVEQLDGTAAVREIRKVTRESLRRSGLPYIPTRPATNHGRPMPHTEGAPFTVEVEGGAGI